VASDLELVMLQQRKSIRLINNYANFISLKLHLAIIYQPEQSLLALVFWVNWPELQPSPHVPVVLQSALTARVTVGAGDARRAGRSACQHVMEKGKGP
jgi:hypothetical protein